MYMFDKLEINMLIVIQCLDSVLSIDKSFSMIVMQLRMLASRTQTIYFSCFCNFYLATHLIPLLLVPFTTLILYHTYFALVYKIIYYFPCSNMRSTQTWFPGPSARPTCSGAPTTPTGRCVTPEETSASWLAENRAREKPRVPNTWSAT